MVDGRLLSAFRFEVSLIGASPVTAGRQRLQGAGDPVDPPAGGNPFEIGNGGFQECTGLEIEMDMQDVQEGGRNNGVIRRVGRAKLQPLVLKRGMFFQPSADDDTDAHADTKLWEWLASVINGERPVPRYDGIVYVKSAENVVRATWVFERGLPAKVRGPELNAKTGEVAIEELHIAHEGLRIAPAGRSRA